MLLAMKKKKSNLMRKKYVMLFLCVLYIIMMSNRLHAKTVIQTHAAFTSCLMREV